jgi:hypothetical protein
VKKQSRKGEAYIIKQGRDKKKGEIYQNEFEQQRGRENSPDLSSASGMSAVGGFHNAGGQHSINDTNSLCEAGEGYSQASERALMHYTEWELQVGSASRGYIYHPLQHNGSVCVIKRTADSLC